MYYVAVHIRSKVFFWLFLFTCWFEFVWGEQFASTDWRRWMVCSNQFVYAILEEFHVAYFNTSNESFIQIFITSWINLFRRFNLFKKHSLQSKFTQKNLCQNSLQLKRKLFIEFYLKNKCVVKNWSHLII